MCLPSGRRAYNADALERACLPFGRRACGAVCLSECAGVGAERALGRVCLYFGRPVYSAERVRLNTCAKHVAGVRAALSA